MSNNQTEKTMKDYSQHNLDVKHYRNGDPILQVQDNKEWTKLTTGAWCYYDVNDHSKGVLYNGYAVFDERGLAPQGYRIPTKEELYELHKNIKLPMAGFRDNNDGLLFNVGSNGVYWSSTVNGTFACYLSFNSGNAYMSNLYMANGFSVRCLEDENSKTINSNKMSNNKQSSVEWLEQALEGTILTHEQIMQTIGLFEQAKEMHKEEIKEAYCNGNDFIGAEQYYNQTFKNK